MNRARPTRKPRTSKVDADIRGHSLFGKPRKEDADIQEAALRLFYLGQDLRRRGGRRPRSLNF